MDAVVTAFGLVFQPYVLVVIALSAIYGLFVGAIPGLTATMATALLVPVTFFMPPVPAVAAIVTATPGTTRDVIEVHLNLAGFAVTLADTAGLRDSADAIEQEGIRRARLTAAAADVRVRYRLPSGLQLAPALSTAGCTVAGSIVTCALGTLAAGTSRSIDLAVREPLATAVLGSRVGYTAFAANVTPAAVDVATLPQARRPVDPTERLLDTYAEVAPGGLSPFVKAVPVWLRDKAWVAYQIEKALRGVDDSTRFYGPMQVFPDGRRVPVTTGIALPTADPRKKDYREHKPTSTQRGGSQKRA